MTSKSINVGIMSCKEFKLRTVAIANGEYKLESLYPDDSEEEIFQIPTFLRKQVD